MDEFINLFLAIVLVVIVSIPFLRLFERRYFYSYQKEIDHYLNGGNLTFEKKVKPQKKDWVNSPFDQLPAFGFRPGIVKFGGTTLPISSTDHWIIYTKEGKRIWFKLETTFGKTAVFSFKPERNK